MRLTHIVVVAGIAACASGGASGSASAPSATSAPTRTSRYRGPTISPALQIDVSQMVEKPSGLFVRELAAGAGIPAQTGDYVRVDYTLYLADGTRIESTVGGAPLEIRLGQQRVVAGWEEALTGMKNGGHKQLIVPPTLGYGMRTRGKVPGGSTLVFDMRVVYVGR